MTKYQDIAMMLDANAITNTVDAYEKGRTDKYQEIISEYMLLTEKQVAEIMADAFERGYICCQDFAESIMKELGIDYTQIFTCDKEEG